MSGDKPILPNNQRIEQLLAFMCDYHPRMWAGMYLRLCKEGVPPDHALSMVIAYIQSTNKSGGSSPNTEEEE